MCLGKKKRTKTINKEEPGLKKSSFKRSASQLGLGETNSFDGDEVMTTSRRKIVRNDGASPEKKKTKTIEEEEESSGDGLSDKVEFEASRIGVFSREAFKTKLGKNWREQMSKDTNKQATKISKERVDEEDQQVLLNRQNRTEETAFEDQINALFKNKILPHIIVVIEGATKEEPITLKTKIKENQLSLQYERSEYVEGLKIDNSSDHRQDMTVYIRDDMKGVYNVSTVEIPREFKGEERKMKAVAIDYQTEDGTKYRTLAVHIRNEYAKGDKKVKETHAAMESYAEKVASNEERIVTGYIGDTNYDKPFYEHSVPSMGGYGSSGEALNPRASANKKDTNYMQHIPLGKESEEYSVRQPSTLNYIFTDIGSVTDHPSIMGYTEHKKRLKGRNPDANPEYYKFDEI